MSARSPVRYMAPLALVASVVIVIVIVAGSGSGSVTHTPRATRAPRHQGPRHRRVVVHTGDSLSRIAVRNHISVARIEQLNPKLDPNNLHVGQRLRLLP